MKAFFGHPKIALTVAWITEPARDPKLSVSYRDTRNCLEQVIIYILGCPSMVSKLKNPLPHPQGKDRERVSKFFGENSAGTGKTKLSGIFWDKFPKMPHV